MHSGGYGRATVDGANRHEGCPVAPVLHPL
jgi:hypothetical protein